MFSTPSRAGGTIEDQSFATSVGSLRGRSAAPSRLEVRRRVRRTDTTRAAEGPLVQDGAEPKARRSSTES